MTQVTVRQPDGKLAIFSEKLENFVACNLNKDQAIEWYIARGFDWINAERKTMEGYNDLNLFTNEPDPSGQFRWKYCVDIVLEVHGRDSLEETINNIKGIEL